MAVFSVQLQNVGGAYQVRIGGRNSDASWEYSSWTDAEISPTWKSVEIEYLTGYQTGLMRLWVDRAMVQTLEGLDNQASKIDMVRLGVMGLSSGTTGTVYFDDFESRRFSAIGRLADPGVHIAPPDEHKVYQYADTQHVHAVSRVVPESGIDDVYKYDENGNMTCRVEGGKTYNQVYNTENRLETVQLLSAGACPAANVLAVENISASWNFIYDGDGNRVRQEYFEGVFGAAVIVKVTSYFAGGSYELDQTGVVQADLSILVSPGITKRYYSLAGMPVALNYGSGLQYLLTDHLGSVVAVTDGSGVPLGQQRYAPFGELRTIAGGSAITTTDYGYTGQRNIDVQNNSFALGLMDYHARFYDSYINRWTQPDTIVPDGNPQSLNRYSYGLNNPVKYNDPTGHDPLNPYIQFIQGAITFFQQQAYEIVGTVESALSKSIYANGADLVFQKGAETLAVELKNVSSNIDLGTLGKSSIGDYGGSIDRVIRSATRLQTSSTDQLAQESRAVLDAGNNLKTALFTNAGKVSQGAQDVFDQVYTNAKGNVADAIKALPAAASSTATSIQAAVNSASSFLDSIPFFIILPSNDYFNRYSTQPT